MPPLNINTDLENAYRQFKLPDLPIFKNRQQISIRKLFKLLTITELEDLSTLEAMNFYLYCQFFKNRLFHSPLFQKNLVYVNLKSIELKQRLKDHLVKYEQMLKTIKSESDALWIENNILILNDCLIKLGIIPSRCDYYDTKVSKCLTQQQQGDMNTLPEEQSSLEDIQAECAAEFLILSKLFSEAGRIIGRE